MITSSSVGRKTPTSRPRGSRRAILDSLRTIIPNAVRGVPAGSSEDRMVMAGTPSLRYPSGAR
jgi:hypothetical protein